LPILKSGVTGPTFTRFTHNVVIADELFKITMAILQSFLNAKVTNKGEESDIANFDPKVGCQGNDP